jgi:HEAT repeat protein
VPINVSDLDTALADLRRSVAGSAERVAETLIAIDRFADEKESRAASALLAKAEPAVWKQLDLAARRSWWNVSSWAAMAKARVTEDDPSTLAVVLASFHPDGFVREAAVARLSEIDEPVALQALTLRTTDWVSQVRERARTGLLARLSWSVSSLIVVGPLAVALERRSQARWLSDQLEASMTRLSDTDLRRVLGAKDWRLRRAAYSIALQEGRLTEDDLLAAAEHDRDLIIRVQCADAAIHAAAAAGRLETVEHLTASGSAAVRAAVVGALGRAGQLEPAAAAPSDRNPIVREVAQAALRRAGVDLTDRYRSLVRSGAVAPGALAGLGETGSTNDANLLRPFLSDPRPRARVETVRALRRLGAVEVASLTPLLVDPSAAVTRQVAISLIPVAGDLDKDMLASLLTPSQARHVRTAAYRLQRASGVWRRILTDLQLHDDTDDDLRNRARGDLSGWLEQDAATTYSMPQGDIREGLEATLRAVTDSLGPRRERLLRFHLGLTDNSTARGKNGGS